jgi:DNA polymerase-1
MLTTLLNDTAIEIEQRTGQPQKRWAEDEVRVLYDGFWEQFPGLKRWLEGVHEQVLETGEVESHFGRRRRWYLWTPELLKEAANHPVQSTASDCLLLGMIEIDAWLKKTGYGRIVLTVHDSLVIEAHELAAVHVADEAVRVLQVVPLRHRITVPFVADAKIGYRWASLLPLEEWLKQGEAAA